VLCRHIPHALSMESLDTLHQHKREGCFRLQEKLIVVCYIFKLLSIDIVRLVGENFEVSLKKPSQTLFVEQIWVKP
jgi:hypothetical protein